MEYSSVRRVYLSIGIKKPGFGSASEIGHQGENLHLHTQLRLIGELKVQINLKQITIVLINIIFGQNLHA